MRGFFFHRRAGTKWLWQVLPAGFGALLLFGWVFAKPLLLDAHFTPLQVALLALAGLAVVLGFSFWTVVVLNRSEKQRMRAEAALQLDKSQLERILESFEDTPRDAALRFWTKAGIALGVLLFLLSLVGYWRAMQLLDQNDQWLAHSASVEFALQTMLVHQAARDGSVRSFALTGLPEFREAFEQGQREFPIDLNRLKALTTENPRQQALIAQLSQQVHARMRITARIVSERLRTGKSPPLEELLEVKRMTYASLATIEIMSNEEHALFELRKEDDIAAHRKLQVQAVVVALLGLTILLAIGGVTIREIDREAKLYRHIESVNAGLELRVAERTAELQESEQQLRLLIDHAPAALAMLDHQMRYLAVSRRWSAMHALGDLDLVGRSHYEFFADIPESWREEHRRCLAGETVPAGERQLKLPDGSVRWIWRELLPWRSGDGSIRGMVLFAEDISARKEAELALRRSEQNVRVLLDSIAEALLACDRDGNCTASNSAALQLLGYSCVEELLGKNLHAMIHHSAPGGEALPRDRCPLFHAIRQAKAFHSDELVYWRKDGSSFPVECWAHPYSFDRTFSGSVLTFIDISERKKNQEFMRYLGAIITSSNDGIFGKTPDGIVTSWNPAAETIYGYSADEILGRNVAVVVPPDHLAELQTILERIRRGEAVQHLETQRIRKDGQRIDVSLSISPLRDENGMVVGASTISRDISGQKRAEDALRENRAVLDAALASVTDAVAITDRTGRYLQVNDGLLRYYRIENREDGFECMDDAPEFMEVWCGDATEPSPVEQWPVPRALRGETVRDAECRLRKRKTGETWIGSYSVAPIRDATGAVTGSIMIARDITEKKAAAQEIQRLNETLEARVAARTDELAAANKELEAFTYSVSHDLRAPLRHVNGFSKMLLEEYGADLPEGALHYVDRILDGNKRMGTLIDDLLNLGRVGRQALRRQTTGLRSLVDEILTELEPECTNRAIEWKIRTLPFVDCDPALVKQVFQNLIANAIKFTRPRSPAIIEIGTIEGNGRPTIYVRDNGVGFSMKYADKLFGVFQRLHRAEDFDGTGVGLAVVQRILQKHGGRIWAEAELDKGATFYFTLASEAEGPATA